MDKNLKGLLFVAALVVLLVGIGSISAADVDGNSTGIQSAVGEDASAASASDLSAAADGNDAANDAADVKASGNGAKKDVAAKSGKTVKTSSAAGSSGDAETDAGAQSSSAAKKTGGSGAAGGVGDTAKNTAATSKSLKTGGNTYTITPDNYAEYCNDSGLTDKVQEGDTLDFYGRFTNSLVINKTVNITSTQGAVFYNTEIKVVNRTDKTTVFPSIKNLFLATSSSDDSNFGITVYDGNSAIIENNLIKIYSTGTVTGITLFSSNNSIVKNNNITIRALAADVVYSSNGTDWEGTPQTYGIGVFTSSNVLVQNNYINISAIDSSSSAYNTIVGINVQGSNIANKTTNKVTVYENEVYIKGKLYGYGINIQYNVKNSNISDNNITSQDDACSYYAGIQLTSYVHNNNFWRNRINISATNNTYGIILQSMGGVNCNSNVFRSNEMLLQGSRVRGIELYLANNNVLYSNFIRGNGDYVNGIGLGGSSYNSITANTIYTNGSFLTPYKDVDEIPFLTGGIYLTDAMYWVGYDNYTQVYAGNTISGNYIQTNGVQIYESHNQTIAIKISDTNHLILNTNGNIHVVTQDNYKTYFNGTEHFDENNVSLGKGLSALVNDGDVLDLQGNITLDCFLYVDKPVNIISSTGDGMLVTNATSSSGGYGPSAGKRLLINANGSYTNITNIKLYNVELFTSGASYVTIDHIDSRNIGLQLGTGTGVHSFRDGSSHINITNSYFHTENNGGHSNVVTAGCTYFTFINNTIRGVGQVGNLFYFTTYNTQAGAENGYGICINNTIIGPESPSAICYAMGISGENNYFEGNYIQYTGYGVMGQWGGSTSSNNTFVNNTFNGTGLSISNAIIKNNKGITSITTGGASEIIGNEMQTLEIKSDSGYNGTVIIANNTIKNANINTNNTLFENNTMNDGLLTISANNVTVVNNTIYAREFYAVTVEAQSNDVTVKENNLYVAENVMTDSGIVKEYTITGDECVNASSNVVVENNGPLYVEFNVTNYGELIEAIENIQQIETQASYIKGYMINLMDGNYTITQSIYWGPYDIWDFDATGVSSVTINGNNQTIYGNGSRFLTIESGYELILKNITIENTRNAISNKGTLLVNHCTFDGNSVSYLIQNTGNAEIGNSIFNNISSGVVSTSSGNLTFVNNKVSNCGGTVLHNLKMDTRKNKYLTIFVQNNIFENNTSTIVDTYSLSDGNLTVVKNTFINNSGLINTVMGGLIIVDDNIYINTSIPTSVSIEQSSAALTDNSNYTSGVTVAVDSSYGVPLSEGKVVVYINGVEYKSFDLVDGKANITVDNEDLAMPSNTITAKYVPFDNNCGQSQATASVTVEDSTTADKQATVLTIDKDILLKSGIGSNIIITLTTSDNTPIANAEISYVAVGTSGSVYTNQSGMAILKYTPYTLGNQTINVTFDGGRFYLSSSDAANVTVLNPVSTNLAVTYDSVVDADVPLNINVALTDDNNTALSNQTIVVLDGNGNALGSGVTDGNGNATLTLSNLGIGENRLSVFYAGKNEYNNKSSDITVTVNQASTYIALDPVAILDSNEFVVSGRLLSGTSSSAIGNGGVRLVFGNASYTTKTNDDGSFSFNVVALDKLDASNEVSVVFDGDDRFIGSSNSTTFAMELVNTTVKLDDVVALVNDVESVSAYVTDANGNKVSGGTVAFVINGTTVGSAGVAGGVATVDVKLLSRYNNSVVMAVYGGSDYYGGSSGTAMVSLSLRKADVGLVVDSITAKGGDSVTFVAQVTDNGVLVDQGYVSFKLNGVTLYDLNGASNKVRVVDGIARFTYTVPSNFTAKDYNLSVVYSGSDYGRVEDHGVLTVAKTSTHIKGSIVNMALDGTATLKVELFDEHNNPAAARNVLVSIKVNGKTVLSRVNVTNGVGYFNITLLPSSGDYNISIVSGENSVYMGSNATFSYRNTNPKVNTTVAFGNVSRVTSNTARVQATIKDVYGRSIQGSTKVAIKVDGKTVLNARAVNGVIDEVINVTGGTHKILVIAGENNSYASSRNSYMLSNQTLLYAKTH